jgi:hypothetical protein
MNPFASFSCRKEIKEAQMLSIVWLSVSYARRSEEKHRKTKIGKEFE